MGWEEGHASATTRLCRKGGDTWTTFPRDAIPTRRLSLGCHSGERAHFVRGLGCRFFPFPGLPSMECLHYPTPPLSSWGLGNHERSNGYEIRRVFRCSLVEYWLVTLVHVVIHCVQGEKTGSNLEVAESLIFQVCDHPEVSCLNNPTTWPEASQKVASPK